MGQQFSRSTEQHQTTAENKGARCSSAGRESTTHDTQKQEKLALSPDGTVWSGSFSSLCDGRGSWDDPEDIEFGGTETATLPAYSRNRNVTELSSLLIPDSPSHRSGQARKRSLASGGSKTPTTWTKLANRVNKGDLLLHSRFGSVRSDDSSINATTTTGSLTREEIKNKIRASLEISSLHCVIAIALYLGLAVIAFSYIFDHWTIVDSMYFAVVTFTTIGYGDMIPDSHAGRLFTAMFALSGVACLGIALGVIGDNVISAQKQAAEKSSNAAKTQVVWLFSPSYSPENQTCQETAVEELSSPPTLWSKIKRMSTELIAVVAFVTIFAVLVNNDPGIDASSWGDVFYFAIITACTVGYGDYAPTSQFGRGVAVIFIPLAVGAMGHCLSIVANLIIDVRQQRFRDKFADHDLTMQDLEVMDADGDGNVTMAEFIEFMLVTMGKVDQDLIDILKKQFKKLDHDHSGSLSRNDLISVARQKLHSPRSKLALAAYKDSLLHPTNDGSFNECSHR